MYPPANPTLYHCQICSIEGPKEVIIWVADLAFSSNNDLTSRRSSLINILGSDSRTKLCCLAGVSSWSHILVNPIHLLKVMCPNTQRSISKRFSQEIVTGVFDDQTDIEDASENDADLNMCGTCCIDYVDRIVASGAAGSWIRCWKTSVPCCKRPYSTTWVRHTKRVSNSIP